jgi:hypothetical protein
LEEAPEDLVLLGFFRRMVFLVLVPAPDALVADLEEILLVLPSAALAVPMVN